MNFQFTFLEAKCDETKLSNSILDLENELNTTVENMEIIKTAKKNLRLVIDCKENEYTREELFNHYENLIKRLVILKNVFEDLQMKKSVLQHEKKRCSERCKFELRLNYVDTLELHATYE